jgi:hypothetical protein
MTGRDDLVVAVGRSGFAASVAAALDRPMVQAADIDDVVRVVETVAAASLLIVPAGRFTMRDAAAVAQASAAAHRSVGFVATWAGVDVAERQLSKLQDYRPRGAHRDLVFAQYGFGPVIGRPGQDLELAAGTHQGADALVEAPHRLLAVVAYGTAVDAEIGDDFVCGLATANGNDRSPDGGHRWPCALAGFCVERYRAEPEARPPSRLLPPAVAADCLIWGVCGAIALDGGTVAVRDTVIAGLLRTSWCRDIIAPYKVTALDTSFVLLGAGLARAGATLGDTAAHLNRASLNGSSADAPWLLLGDPAGRLPGIERERPPESIPRGDAEVTLRTGELQLWRTGPSDAVVTCRCDEPPRTLSRRLIVRPVPGTDLVVTFLASGDPARVAMDSAQADNLPQAVQHALSIRAHRGSATALRRLLDVAARVLDPRHRPPLADIQLRLSTHARSTWSHLSPDARLWLLARRALGLLDQCETERRQWAELHAGALEYLWLLADRNPGVTAYLHRTSTPFPSWRLRDDDCPYCGTALEECLYRVGDSDDERSRIQCQRCGMISDAPSVLGVVLLASDAVLEPGDRLSWSLALSLADCEWTYGVATAGFERVPWDVVEAAGTSSGWIRRDDQPAPLSGVIDLKPEVPAGIYGCLAIGLLQCEPCFARRLVQVGKPAGDQGGRER